MNDTEATVRDILSGRRPICLSLYVAGGIAVAIVILTCCCTLCVRNKCARIFNKLTGRRKKEKYFPANVEEGRGWKRGTARKLRKKRKRPISPEVTEQSRPEATAPVVKEPERSENGSPITCYKCYRKKKRGKRPGRQTR